MVTVAVGSLHVLDDPVRESLRGRHRLLARRRGDALAYLNGVATFVAVPPSSAPGDWADLAALLGPGGFADMFSSPAIPPPDWAPVFTMAGVQMVAADQLDRRVLETLAGRDPDAAVVVLGEPDVADMRDLVSITHPGPFWDRTHEMGTYVGVRRDGRLVAMAGQRLSPPGWSEISAVATHPWVRGQGLAGQVVSALAARIVAAGDRPFLHVAADNDPAMRLYQRLGFQVRKEVTFRGFRVPPLA